MALSSSMKDVDKLIEQLDLKDKIGLLSGQGSFRTTGLKHLGIPALTTSDGPHGLRGPRSFERNPSCLLPSATAMGATFDVDLLRRIGNLLGDEARCKNVHVLLAPTVCLQRSPLIGRGFEAFGEDPILSGALGASYIDGVQSRGVAACIKHYAAHDQSDTSIEDNIRMTDRTLRELHLLPFQLAFSKSDPWTIMSAYHKINGIHTSEDPLLLKKILRDEWGFKGLVMSDWWGVYSTSEAINAGLDLEMPGPPEWRGKLLNLAVQSRKVPHENIDASVRNVLNLVKKVTAVESPYNPSAANTPENRKVIRQVAAESIVLLKNQRKVLPITQKGNQSYGLIGSHFKTPALGGGGSAEVEPYYSVTPYDAMVEQVGEEKIAYLPGCYSFKFSPFLKNLKVPNSTELGYMIEIFGENPESSPNIRPVYRITTQKDLIDVPDSLHASIPTTYFVRAQTLYTAENSSLFRFGLSVAGKAKLKIDGKNCIDLWTSHPVKTDNTPVFNRLSMERFADVKVTAGQTLALQVLMTNESIGTAVGILPTLTARLGGYEVIDEDKAILEAAELAKKVDIPIIIAGLSSDYEYEGCDRKTLRLPPRVDSLVQTVLEANQNTIVITQSGCPIEMPWEYKAETLLHAWFGGQETGHGMVDVLFGNTNPSGRVSVTFPKSIKHTPSYLTFGKVDRDILYGEGVFIGHRYYEKVERDPLFYFGYGLSYTQFQYSNLVVPTSFEASAEHTMDISVDLKNAGPYHGSEVVQIYVQDPESSVQRPLRELKAFSKVKLSVGEKKTVKITLDKYAISFWSEEISKWKAEAGEFIIIVATSSDPKDEVLRTSFKLPSTFYWSGL